MLAARWKSDHVERLFAFFPNEPIGKFASPIVKAEADKLGIQYDEALFISGIATSAGYHARQELYPDAIFIYGHGTPDEGVIMKQIWELGMTTQIYGGLSVTSKSYREAAGKAAEGGACTPAVNLRIHAEFADLLHDYAFVWRIVAKNEYGVWIEALGARDEPAEVALPESEQRLVVLDAELVCFGLDDGGVVCPDRSFG